VDLFRGLDFDPDRLWRLVLDLLVERSEARSAVAWRFFRDCPAMLQTAPYDLPSGCPVAVKKRFEITESVNPMGTSELDGPSSQE
jgi:hypothetical protein